MLRFHLVGLRLDGGPVTKTFKRLSQTESQVFASIQQLLRDYAQRLPNIMTNFLGSRNFNIAGLNEIISLMLYLTWIYVCSLRV